MAASARRIDIKAAQAYERFMVPSLFGPWVDDVVTIAAPRPGELILDVACGTGIAARLAARRVTDKGTVAGVDIDPAMLEVARLSATSSGGAIPAWCCGSALETPFEDGTFDAVLCLQGLQFFPDAIAGLREIHRILKPTGRLAASVWRTIEHCRGHYALARALERHGIDAGAAKRPFSLGDAGELRRLAHEGGFRDVQTHAVAKLARFPSPRQFVESLAAGAPSTRHALDRVPESERPGLIEELSTVLLQYAGEDGVAIPYASHLVSARA